MLSLKSYGQDETKKFILKAKDASICDGGKLNLSVDVSWEMNNLTDVIDKIDDKYLEQIHHTVNWYFGENDINPIGKGISFTTPEILNSKTYYTSVNYIGGLQVITDDLKKVDGEGLMFNLTAPTLINSVDVYSNMPGKISVVIKKSDGTQVISKSYTLINGLNKLPLNCSLPSGWGFIIEAFGLSPDIKLTTIKPDTWPVSLGAFGEIVEGTENKRKYNYFFNWDVSTARVPVSASIIKSTQNITTKSECDKYFWTETSETYDKSGTYSKVYGCHTEKLKLTITPSSKKTESITACDSYTWSANNQKYLISGTYTSISNCLTQELVLTLEPSITNVAKQTAIDSFTWGINNKKYEFSGTYIETKGCLTEKLELTITYTIGSAPQSVLNNRNPDKRKDYVNVYFDPKYTLFDLWSDEPILPDENGIYHIWLSSNEGKIPSQFDGSAEMLSKMETYKFKNLSNCKNWCDNIPFSNTANSDANKTNSTSKTQTFKEVKIGNQIWMKENLNVEYFRNGDPITEPKTSEEFERSLKYNLPYWRYYNKPTGGCVMSFLDKDKVKKYGKMYNVRALMDPRGLAPEGWHIPTEEEWKTLIEYLGGDDKAGAKLKSSIGWESYTTGGAKTCPHCKDWNPEYRSNKRGCDVCRDTKYVPAPTQTHSSNGSNSSAFTAFPAGHGINEIFKEGVAGKNVGYWTGAWEKYDEHLEGKKLKWVELNQYNDINFDYIIFDTKGESGHQNTHVFYIRCIKD